MLLSTVLPDRTMAWAVVLCAMMALSEFVIRADELSRGLVVSRESRRTKFILWAGRKLFELVSRVPIRSTLRFLLN